MKKQIERIIKTIIYILLILVVLVLVAVIGFIKKYEYKDDQILRMNKFNKIQWLSCLEEDGHLDWDHKANCTRGKMYYDLIENHLKLGVAKNEVFELLGKPMYGLKYPNNLKRQYCIEYELGGSCSSFSGPTKIMLVCLQDNRVVEIFTSTVNDDKGETFLIDEEIEQ